MIGQINLSSEAGQMIKKISEFSDVKTIVEIGTWNGAGSTACVAEGLKTNPDASLVSFECSKPMYSEAEIYWRDTKNIKIVWGRIVEESELDVEGISEDEKGWLQDDLVAMRECDNVYEQVPDIIEFSTLAEFNKLVNRTKYIFLDDTRLRKTKKIRQFLLDSDDFVTLEDKQDILLDSDDFVTLEDKQDRNGWSVFKRDECTSDK
jgi:hypothetical protein